MDGVDVDEVLRELQARVAERRRTGDYPPGLEEQLEADFEAIMRAAHRHEVNTTELGRQIAQVEASTSGVRGIAAASSRIPGGSALHASAARLVQRHTGLLADTVRQLGTDMTSALHEVRHLVDAQRSADERQLVDVIGAMLDRVAILDHLAEAVVDLERRVEVLEAGGPGTTPA